MPGRGGGQRVVGGGDRCMVVAIVVCVDIGGGHHCLR